jgi:tape measure domain-containing protein
MATIGARDAYLTEVILALRDQLSAEGRRAGATLDYLDRSADGLTGTFGQTSQASERFGSSLGKLGLQALALNEIRGLILGLLAPLQAVGEASDTWKELSGRVAIFSKEGTNTAGIMARIAQIAQESRTPLKEVGTLYSRLAQGLSEQNVSQQDLLGIVQSMSDALLISGASASEAAGAIWQFSQGIASGTLRGEEFNSVAEQAPVLLDALSKELKVAKGSLRDMAAEGQLTSKVVISAISNMSEEWRAQAQIIPLTIGRAMENLKSAFTEYIGTAEGAPEIMTMFAESLEGLGKNLAAVGEAADTAAMIAMVALMVRGSAVAASYAEKQRMLKQAEQDRALSMRSTLRESNALSSAEDRRAAALRSTASEMAREATGARASAQENLKRAKAVRESAKAEIEKAEATIVSSREDRMAAVAASMTARANLERAAATKQAAASDVLHYEQMLLQNPALARNTRFTDNLTRARRQYAIANADVVVINRQLAAQEELIAGATVQSAIATGDLTAQRLRLVGADNLVAAAERRMSAALSKNQLAMRALTESAQSGAKRLADLVSVSGLLKVAVGAFIGIEVSKWILGIAAATEEGRDRLHEYARAIDLVSEGWGRYAHAYIDHLDVQEKADKKLAAFNKTLGTHYMSLKDVASAMDEGSLVFNKSLNKWEKGIAVQKTLAQGMGDVDTAYIRTIKAIEGNVEATNKMVKANTDVLETRAATMKALGDERGALNLLLQAKGQELKAAGDQAEATQNLLALAKTRVEVAKKQAIERGNDNAAAKNHIAELEREVVSAKAAADAASAHQQAMESERMEAEAATLTYGDQSAKLGELTEARRKLNQELKDLTPAASAHAEATAGLEEANKALLKAQLDVNDEVSLGGANLGALMFAYTEAKAKVDEFTTTIANDAAAAARSVEIQKELALNNKLVADAARDAAARLDEKIDAMGREQGLMAARADIQIADIARRQEMAKAEGDEVAALNLMAEGYRQELNLIRESASAKRDEALLLSQKADAMEIAAKATGDYTAEERAAVAAMRDTAELAGLSAKRMDVDAKAKRNALDATRALANQQRVLSEEFGKVGATGIKTMDDVRNAIQQAADSEEIDALGRALYAAFQKGVLSADEYKKALDEVLAKTRDLKEENKSKPSAINFDRLFEQFGTDASRVGKAFYNRANPTYGVGVQKSYEAWLAAKRASATGAESAPMSGPEAYFAQEQASREANQSAFDQQSKAAAAAAAAKDQRKAFRTVRVELVSGGKTSPVDVVEGHEDNLIDALKRARLYSN